MKVLSVLYLIAIHGLISLAQAQLLPAQLQCEYREDPIGIDETKPRLSWLLVSGNGQGRQTGYRILVASSPEILSTDQGDLWDSGKILSSNSVNIPYGGTPLKAFQECYWKVRVWDEIELGSAWSEPALFTMGPMKELDWNADWISSARDEETSNFPWLRKEFLLREIPARAYAHINVLGYFELYINGIKVGKDILSPSVSDYSKQSLYVSYDITPFLKAGNNCIGLWIAHGWYRRDEIKYFGVLEDRPIARALLEFKGQHGKSEFIPSDRTWKYHLSNRGYTGKWRWGQFGGEQVRTGKMISDWSRPGIDDSDWKQVDNYALPKVPVRAQRNHPTRIIDSLYLVKVEPLGKQKFLLDFGRHITGWLDFRFNSLLADSLVVIDYIDKLLIPGEEWDPLEKNFAEKLELDPQGRSMITYNQQDLLYPDKNTPGQFRNRFNYHAFRWVMIQGLQEISKPDIRAFLISENMATVTQFESSNSLLNEIWATVNHTYRCLTYGGYVVDCPHRERVGYGGDSHSSMETALSNFDMAALYNKWTLDWNNSNYPTGMWPHSSPEIPQHQNKFSPGWGGFGMFLPWQFYVYYGDTVNLSRAYPYIRRWMEYLHSNTSDGILHADTERGFSTQWSFHGDWVAPSYSMQADRRVDARSTLFFNNCYYLYNLDLAARISKVLNRPEEQKKYLNRMASSREKIHQTFFNATTRDYVNGEQPYQAFPLFVGLVPEELQESLDQHLEYLIMEKNHGHLNTGMLGTYFLFEYLMATGRNDLIYTMVNQKTFPGWGYMLEKGATTLWEQWNGHNSQIHNCYLSVGKWFVQGLAGIRPDEGNPGFSHFNIVPGLLENLDYVRVSYRIRRGTIISNWRRMGKEFVCEVEVPTNTSATFVLPGSGMRVKLNQKRIKKFITVKEFKGPCLQLSPGKHLIQIKP